MTTSKVCQPYRDGNPLGVPAHRHINPDGAIGGWVAETARVSGDAQVFGNARVSGTARVFGNAWVSGTARVFGDAQVSGDARVFGNARVFGDARVFGNARVSGTARVFGNARVSGDAQVSEVRHVMSIGPIGSEDQNATLVRTETGHLLTIGCWQDGTVDALAAEVQRRCPDRADEYAEIDAVLRRRITEWEVVR